MTAEEQVLVAMGFEKRVDNENVCYVPKNKPTMRLVEVPRHGWAIEIEGEVGCHCFDSIERAIGFVLNDSILIIKGSYRISISRYFCRGEIHHFAWIERTVNVALDSEAKSLIDGLLDGEVPEDIVHDKILELEK